MLGRALHKASREPEAIEVLREGLARHPGSDDIAYLLGRVLVHTDAFEEAHQIFELLRGRTPRSPLPFAGLASLSLNSGRWEDARRYAAEAIARDAAGLPDLAVELAATVMEIPGASHLAEPLLTRAAQVYPLEPTIHLLLGVLLEGTDQDRAQAHLATAERTWRDSSGPFGESASFIRERLRLSRQPPGR